MEPVPGFTMFPSLSSKGRTTIVLKASQGTAEICCLGQGKVRLTVQKPEPTLNADPAALPFKWGDGSAAHHTQLHVMLRNGDLRQATGLRVSKANAIL